jgi:nitrogen fixation/metabolism regulation signal transduction histidine kinase
MSSGVITMGSDEKISLCNHRASEILQKSVSTLLGEDLRHLPSPLGDLLYETFVHGVTYQQHTIEIAEGKRLLKVNTYQIMNNHRQVAGSVLVFDDLSLQRQCDEERRRAEQIEFLHKFVGRMAHEIKNPR